MLLCCPGPTELPVGEPPKTLDSLLLSEDWYPVFLNFLRDGYQMAEDEEQAQAGLKLLRACQKMYPEDPKHSGTKEKRKEILKNIKKDCKDGLNNLVQDFLIFVNKERNKAYHANTIPWQSFATFSHLITPFLFTFSIYLTDPV